MSGQETQSNNRPQGKKPQSNRPAGQGASKQGSSKQGSSKQSRSKQGANKQGSNEQGPSRQRPGNQQRSGPSRESAKAPAKASKSKVTSVITTPVKVAQTVVTPRRSPIQKIVVGAFGAGGLLIGAIAGLITGLYLLAVLGAVAGAAVGMFVYRNLVGKAFDSAISLVPARATDAQNEPRLFNLLASLCAVSGVQMPTVSMCDDASLNACVFTDPSHKGVSHIIFTRGLLQSLSRIELEGVIAACLARIKSGQLEVQTEVTGILHVLGGVVPATVRSRVLSACAEAQEVFDADVKACGITRYPPGLIAAYEHFEDESTVTVSSSASVAHLWLANPLGEALPRHKQSTRGDSALVSKVLGSTVEDNHVTHPALAIRIALLREI